MDQKQESKIYIDPMYKCFFINKIEINMMNHAFSQCFPHATTVLLEMTNDDHILLCNEGSNKEYSEGDVYLCA